MTKMMCVLAVACVFAVVSVMALPPIAFRLDDIQCQYLEMQQMAIVNAFLDANVPLTLGIITGATGCYVNWLKPLVDGPKGYLLELASHSATHVYLEGSFGAQPDLVAEIKGSRDTLQTQFPGRTIDLFIPPFNAWNLTVAAAVAAAGYTKMSVLCTQRNILPIGQSTGPDNACVTNMYPLVDKPFFAPVDGITYIPIGTSTATFATTGGAAAGTLVTVSNVLDSSTAECAGTSGICSIPTQIAANYPRMVQDSVPFAVVMMHPQEFNGASYTQAQITSYITDLITQSKTRYTLHTVSNLLTAVRNLTSSSSGGTGSASTGSSTGGSVKASTGKNAASSTMAGAVVSAVAAVAAAFAFMQ